MSAARERKDLSASVRARLLNLARQRGEQFEYTLTRYGIERMLYRIGQSRHAARFVLKGAVLFSIWTGQEHRATRDIDLLGEGAPDLERLKDVFREIATLPVPEDGLRFDPESFEVQRLREGEEYEGVRVTGQARLGTARIPIQIDVGTGDAITPGPIDAELPVLLDGPRPRLRVYPRETAVAEKLEAMVSLGIANSRMKDFFDVDFLAREFAFEGTLLIEAVRRTFERRRTVLPVEPPLALTPQFGSDGAKQRQWIAFLRRIGRTREDLGGVVSRIRGFASPVLRAASAGEALGNWPPGGPWSGEQRS